MDKLTSFMEQHKGESSLHDLVAVFWRRKLGMALIFGGVIVVVAIITLLQTPIYEIGSSVIIKYGREYVYHPVNKLDQGAVQPALTYNNEVIINTELEIFRSNELIEKVINELGLKKLYSDLASQADKKKNVILLAIKTFKKNLTVKHITGSSVISISFQHQTPETAVAAVNLLIECFKEKHLHIFKNPQNEFLQQQVDLYRKKLQNCEDNLKSFKQENQIYGLGDQRKFLVQQLVTVKTILIEGRSHSAELQNKIVSLREQMGKYPENVELYEESSQSKNIDNARSKLLDLKLKEQEILDKYKGENRLLKSVRKEIKMVRKFLNEADVNVQGNTRMGKNIVYQKLEKDLVEAEVSYNSQLVKNEATIREIEQLEKRLQELSEKEIELKRLKLQVEITEENYKNFVVKQQVSQIDEEMDSRKMVNVVVIEKPTVPTKPIKPRKKINILVGFILGAAIAMTYAVFFEHFVGQETTTGKKQCGA